MTFCLRLRGATGRIPLLYFSTKTFIDETISTFKSVAAFGKERSVFLFPSAGRFGVVDLCDSGGSILSTCRVTIVGV